MSDDAQLQRLDANVSCPHMSPNSANCSTNEEMSEITLLQIGNISLVAEVSTTESSGSDVVSTWADMFSTISSVPGSSSAAGNNGFGAEVMIPLYSIIFILSVIGNILVIVTLTQNRRMRTVTNVFLLNLAIADLLLGVFCMPFTLIGQLLRDFIFGSFMCKFIPYLQAVSVAVGVWTLVAISLERYFAICRPLKSRIWQTRSHAYKMIVGVWILSLSLCLPVAVLSHLKPIRQTGRHKCREEWPDNRSEKAYNLLLDVILLVLPLLIMGLAYWLIAARLWRGLRRETNSGNSNQSTGVVEEPTATPLLTCSPTCIEHDHELDNSGSLPSVMNSNEVSTNVTMNWSRSNHRRLCCNPPEEPRNGTTLLKTHQQRFLSRQQSNIKRAPVRQSWRDNPQPTISLALQHRPSASIQIMDYRQAARHGVRSTYTDKSVWAKKKVIRMLFVIVFEFFLCWAPLYVVNTWYAFDPVSLYKQMGPTEIALVQLLAYVSSCCNPITYCFMNEKFRNAFLSAFGCGRPIRRFGCGVPNRSTDLLSASLNDSFNLGRRSFKGKSSCAGNSRMSNTVTTDIVETSLQGDEFVLIHPPPCNDHRSPTPPLME